MDAYYNKTTDIEEFISLKKPTAQAKILAIQLMSDHAVHSRKEIIQYIKDKGAELGLPEYSEGVISGSLQSILSMPECEKLGVGTYRLVSSDEKNDISLLGQASNICENAIADIQNIARKIDYITASDDELKDLQKLKSCVVELESIAKQLLSD